MEYIRNRPVAFWSALGFLWIIWISGVFGNQGLLQAMRLRNVRVSLEEKQKTLSEERDRLQGEIYFMETDRQAQEVVIRDTLGFVKDNELVFEFSP